MADKNEDSHWMEKAFANAHGQLRAETHTPAGQDISMAALHGAERAKSLTERRQAHLAEEARGFHEKKD